MNQNLLYPIEELIPIVEMLADKYTSKESSSVSYDTVERLLHNVDSRYENRFMDNICYFVLEYAVKCMLTNNPVTEQKKESIDLMETKIIRCIHILLEQGFKGNTNMQKYFEGAGRELAVRWYYTV